MDHKAYVAELIDQVKAIVEEIGSFSELSETQLNWRYNEDSWSFGQCLDHLIVTNTPYFNRIENIIKKGMENHAMAKKPFKSSLLGKISISSMRPGSKSKYKTPAPFQPSSSSIGKDIIHKFVENQHVLIQLIRQSENLDLNKLKIISPVTVFVRFRLGDCFQFLIVHEQRHMVQAKRVLSMDQFPHS